MDCACGRPLHYTDPKLQAQMDQLVAELGPDVEVRVGRRRFRVPRHYIALHGIKAAELPDLGFPEVTALV